MFGSVRLRAVLTGGRSRAAALLCAAGLVGAGCRAPADESGAAPEPESTQAGLPSFSRTGSSRDLLPMLRVDSPLRRVHRKLPPACSEGESPKCRLASVRDDRRRSLLLEVPARERWPVEVHEGEELRFALAPLGPGVAGADVKVSLSGREGIRRWAGSFGGKLAWLDGRLADLEPGPHELEVHVSGADRGTVAFAAPRLIRPTELAQGPSNVVLYLIDTLRADHTSVHGYFRDTTPHLKKLADGGVTFERTYSVAATTRPVTASVFTSLYPSQHSAWRGRGLGRDVETLAEGFRRAGWSTWAFVTNGHVFGWGLGFEQGFDRFQAIRGVRRDNHARTEEVNDLLISHLGSFGDEPFFLYVHTVDPHSPYDPPASVRGTFTDPGYAGEVRGPRTRSPNLRKRELDAADLEHVLGLYDEDILYQDAMLGVLLDELRRLDLLADTLIVVIADHGDEFLEHGAWEHGNRLYQEQIHVPFVLASGAEAMPRGVRISTPVSLVDVLPTLFSLWNLPIPDQAVGRDLRELMAGRGNGVPIYSEERAAPFGPRLRSVVDGRWKLIEWLDVVEGQRHRRRALFDLESGDETRDVSEEHPERAAALNDHLRKVRRAIRRAPKPERGEEVRLDERTRRQLEALGYVMKP